MEELINKPSSFIYKKNYQSWLKPLCLKPSTEKTKSTLYKLNVMEPDLPLELLGHFQVESFTKTCLVNRHIYHWSEDEEIISLESYDIEKREFSLRWSKHRDEFEAKIHLNRTAGCFTMLHYDWARDYSLVFTRMKYNSVAQVLVAVDAWIWSCRLSLTRECFTRWFVIILLK